MAKPKSRGPQSMSRGSHPRSRPHSDHRKASKMLASRRRSRKKGPPTLAILIGVVVVLGGLATLLTKSGGKGVTGAVTITGTALPKYDHAVQPDPAVGSPVPDLSGKNFEGTPVSIVRGGNPKVIIFLAHWCPHCQNEVPALQGWIRQHGMPQGVDLFSVSTSVDASRDNYPPDKWLKREGWTVPVIADDAKSSARDAFGLSGFPYWVFVDAKGNVFQRADGEMSLDAFEGILAQLRATAGSVNPSPTPS